MAHRCRRAAWYQGFHAVTGARRSSQGCARVFSPSTLASHVRLPSFCARARLSGAVRTDGKVFRCTTFGLQCGSRAITSYVLTIRPLNVLPLQAIHDQGAVMNSSRRDKECRRSLLSKALLSKALLSKGTLSLFIWSSPACIKSQAASEMVGWLLMIDIFTCR